MALKRPDEYAFLDPQLQKCPDDLQYHPTFFLRGLKSLPIRLVPRREAG